MGADAAAADLMSSGTTRAERIHRLSLGTQPATAGLAHSSRSSKEFCAKLRLFSISLSPRNARGDERFRARHPDCAALPGLRPSGTCSREHTYAARTTSRHRTSNFVTSPMIVISKRVPFLLPNEI